MTETLLSIALSLTVLGGVTYGLMAIIKPFIPKNWRQATRLGRASMLALPLLLGGALSVASINSLLELVSALTGGPDSLDVLWQAEFILGMFSGTFATQIHTTVKSRIKRLVAKALLAEEELDF